MPLASASVASGSTAGLVAYATAPWLLGSGLRTLGATPFSGDGLKGTRGRNRKKTRSEKASRAQRLDPFWQAVFASGAAAGAAALFVPAAAGLTVVIAAGLAAGSLLVGRPGGIPRLAVATASALLIAAVLVFPFAVDLVSAGPTWAVLADGRDGSAGAASLPELLRFAVGPDDEALRTWLLFVPMLLPLLLGRGWRLEQSVRLWMVAMAAWGLAFVSQQGFLSFGLPDVQLLLAPAAAAAAALCGMAVVSVEHDLASSRFGYRQALVPVASAAALLLAAGSVELLEEGRWGTPAQRPRLGTAIRARSPVGQLPGAVDQRVGIPGRRRPPPLTMAWPGATTPGDETDHSRTAPSQQIRGEPT